MNRIERTVDAIVSRFSDPDEAVREAMDVGIAESNRITRAKFDGLLGSLPAEGSALLSNIFNIVRGKLLDHYEDDEVLALLAEHAPMEDRNVTEVPDDVDLALQVLRQFRYAAKFEGDELTRLLLGKAGLRDEKRQAGTRKERRPKVTAWIERRLSRDPSAKCPHLWDEAPAWITDDIGIHRFTKRVTDVRKRLGIGRK